MFTILELFITNRLSLLPLNVSAESNLTRCPTSVLVALALPFLTFITVMEWMCKKLLLTQLWSITQRKMEVSFSYLAKNNEIRLLWEVTLKLCLITKDFLRRIFAALCLIQHSFRMEITSSAAKWSYHQKIFERTRKHWATISKCMFFSMIFVTIALHTKQRLQTYAKCARMNLALPLFNSGLMWRKYVTNTISQINFKAKNCSLKLTMMKLENYSLASFSSTQTTIA